ncbi:hypothetical protein NQT62_01095 [Limnobacter humi]|uniref:Pilus assembly protein PilP n=1 Tax=Limnobacter humi TaxID=1778671 RepID=A0ABT1WBZ7_9BURK|nr:hypothetical protein [Limnobacter humi]MCQ8895030.1 hypothetical protein [Limnobacter humi]
MRINRTAFLVLLFLVSEQILAAGSSGSISIRALADRQRKIEEAEFLNKLNGTPAASSLAEGVPTPAEPGQPAMPPLRNFFPAVEEEPVPARNTVMAIYGPLGELKLEVADGKGGVQTYRQGDVWNGHRIVSLSEQGVVIEKTGSTKSRRTISVGARP